MTDVLILGNVCEGLDLQLFLQCYAPFSSLKKASNSSELRCDTEELQVHPVKQANNTHIWIDESKQSTVSGADLFGVELHLVLSLWKKIDVVGAVDFLSDCSNLISNRKLERNIRS